MVSKSEQRLSKDLKKFARIELVEMLGFHVGEKLAVQSGILVEAINTTYKLKITKGTLRDMIAYIRTNRLIKNLIANNSGYWVEPSKERCAQYAHTIISRITEQYKILDSINHGLERKQTHLFE